MEFFPANRACRKSASCSSITVCCRRKIGACPGTREPKRKKRFALETWDLDGAELSCGLLFFDFLLFSFFERVLAFYWRGASAALLQNLFTFVSRCRHIVDQNSEFWFTWRIVVARNTRGSKMVISVDSMYLSPQKGKLAAQCCAMISCNWDLVRGVSCGSSLLGFMKLLFRTISKILCWRGGLAALLQKVRCLLRYDSDGQWMDVGWMSTGNRFLMNGDLIEYQCYEKCLRYNGQPMKWLQSKALGFLAVDDRLAGRCISLQWC